MTRPALLAGVLSTSRIAFTASRLPGCQPAVDSSCRCRVRVVTSPDREPEPL
jgi:hypothetical protein